MNTTLIERKVTIVGVAVVGTRQDIGAAESARRPPGSRNRYSYKLEYTLADGRKIDGLVTGATRVKLESALASRVVAGINKSMTAEFSETGEYWGTTQSYSIG